MTGSDSIAVVAEPSETIKKQKQKKTETTPTASLSVYQRMILAQQVIDSMPWVKDLTNAQFKSIPIDAMRNGVRKACIQAGLVCVGPLDLHYDIQSRDGRLKVYTGTCVFRYINADDPHEYIDYPSLGEAMDTGDKGAGKLLSNLAKSHYKTCFFIGEQGKDDIDSYSNEDMIAEADRIAERRARRQEAIKEDRFFKAQATDELAELRKKIGAYSMLGEDYLAAVNSCKAKWGKLADWTLEQVRECVQACEAVKAAKEGGQ